MANVAQWLEHQIVILRVTGSSPAIRPRQLWSSRYIGSTFFCAMLPHVKRLCNKMRLDRHEITFSVQVLTGESKEILFAFCCFGQGMCQYVPDMHNTTQQPNAVSLAAQAEDNLTLDEKVAKLLKENPKIKYGYFMVLCRKSTGAGKKELKEAIARLSDPKHPDNHGKPVIVDDNGYLYLREDFQLLRIEKFHKAIRA